MKQFQFRSEKNSFPPVIFRLSSKITCYNSHLQWRARACGTLMSVTSLCECACDKMPRDQQKKVYVANAAVFFLEPSSHLRLSLLAVDDLGRDDLGGGSRWPWGHAFGLGDDHLGDWSGCGDDGWFGALHSLKAFFTLNTNNNVKQVTLRFPGKQTVSRPRLTDPSV